MHIRYPIYVTNKEINHISTYDENQDYYFSGKYAFYLEHAIEIIPGCTNAVYAKRDQSNLAYKITSYRNTAYNNVILCYSETEYNRLKALDNLKYMIPIYTIDIEFERFLKLEQKSFKPLVKKGVNIKRGQKLVCGENLECALNIKDAQKKINDHYPNYIGLYIIKDDRYNPNYYGCYDENNKYKFPLRMKNNPFLSYHGFVFYPKNEENNYHNGGSKKKIHTGKRGGKYYIKNGKKVYV